MLVEIGAHGWCSIECFSNIYFSFEWYIPQYHFILFFPFEWYIPLLKTIHPHEISQFPILEISILRLATVYL